MSKAKTKHPTQKVVIYARMSHADGDDEESLGISRQVAMCEEVINDKDGWVLTETFIDDGFSGWDPKVERPDYNRMLEAVDEGHIDVVVAYALDRLSRLSLIHI